MKVEILLALFFATSMINCQSIKEICKACGDVVNDYCCRYYNNCCDCKF